METMTDREHQELQETEHNRIPDTAANTKVPGSGNQEESRSAPGNLRQASYVVLFIAAVFVTNAMETGSYRTPWPVAIIVALAGFGLLGYSWYLQLRPKE
jgi:protein-S-isoprenylcysteine O-methyltransferase Ste14